jgi:predicted MPP superfamily phosphohydrolase
MRNGVADSRGRRHTFPAPDGRYARLVESKAISGRSKAIQLLGTKPIKNIYLEPEGGEHVGIARAGEMKTILHLSDLHFGWDKNESRLKNEREICLGSLLRVISSLDPEWRPSIVCITGDIGWKGLEQDYVDVGPWLKGLLDRCGLGFNQLILCPGNHDVYRPLAQKIVRPSDPNVADEELGSAFAPHLLDSFKNYIHFCESCGVPPLEIEGKHSFLVGSRYLEPFRFVVLNSAWFSKDDEDKDKLWLGRPQLLSLEAQGRLSSLGPDGREIVTITLMHHPKEYMHPNEVIAITNRPSTWDYLARRCHIILSGHTHGGVRGADQVNEGAYHFCGGAAYAGAAHFNSFRLIRVDEGCIVHRSFEFNPHSFDNSWLPYPASVLMIGRETLLKAREEFMTRRANALGIRSALRDHALRFLEQKEIGRAHV